MIPESSFIADYLVTFQATKSSGRLKPPLRFIYCLYLRLRMTCTAPGSFSVTCFPLVVSNAQNPIVRIISISSTLFPSKSFSANKKPSAAILSRDFNICIPDTSGLSTLFLSGLLMREGERLARLWRCCSLSRDLSRDLDLSLSRDLVLSRSLDRSLERDLTKIIIYDAFSAKSHESYLRRRSRERPRLRRSLSRRRPGLGDRLPCPISVPDHCSERQQSTIIMLILTSSHSLHTFHFFPSPVLRPDGIFSNFFSRQTDQRV